MDAHRRVAVITGASSGIGLASARLLAGQGWGVVLAARGQVALEQTAADLGSDAHLVVADVGEAAGCEAIVSAAVERFGRVDALVNNAGFAPLASIEATSDDLLSRVYAVNALGPARLIARVWPIMAAQRSGCIVNVSTIGAVREPFPGFFAYASAKASLGVMARSCALEGRRLGIRAFAVAPGAVETPMLRANFDAKAIAPSRCLAASEVAEVIVACIRGDRDSENGRTIEMPSP
ncbi:MAG: SDR family oxidoreductase [Phycisphaeraceae bacterium]|nr:SDR family oxidoreductase [Phycisphaeraceae bacterium]